jgi:hypothetical protein
MQQLPIESAKFEQIFELVLCNDFSRFLNARVDEALSISTSNHTSFCHYIVLVHPRPQGAWKQLTARAVR